MNQWGRDHGPAGAGIAATFDATLGLGLLGGEAIGLGGDVGLDWVKNKVLNNGESCRDEGAVGPVFGNGLKKRGIDPVETYLPGVRSNGSVDWEW